MIEPLSTQDRERLRTVLEMIPTEHYRNVDGARGVVAEAAGVSGPTITYAVNGKPMREGTRRRVLQAIDVLWEKHCRDANPYVPIEDLSFPAQLARLGANKRQIELVMGMLEEMGLPMQIPNVERKALPQTFRLLK